MFLFLVDGNRDLDDPTDAVPRRTVPRVHPPEQRRGRRRPHPGCVPVPRRVRRTTSSGASSTWPASGAATWARRSRTRGRLRSKACARPSTPTPPAIARCSSRATSQELGADARRGDRGGRATDRSVAEAGLGGVRPGGTPRDESPFDLGLRAGADATQPTHVLAGRTVRPRPRRQPPPRHGQLTLALAARAHPPAASLPRQPLTRDGPGHPHPPRRLDRGPTCRALQSQRPPRWRSVCASPPHVSFVRPRSAGGPGAAVRGPSPVRASGITNPILGLDAGPSRLFASLRPRQAGLAALTAPACSPGFGQYVMPEGSSPRPSTTINPPERRNAMRDFATTPSIDITIGRQTRLYHAFVTTAPAALDSPSTVTLYTSTLTDLAGFAAADIAHDIVREQRERARPRPPRARGRQGTRLAPRAVPRPPLHPRTGRPGARQPHLTAALALAAPPGAARPRRRGTADGNETRRG